MLDKLNNKVLIICSLISTCIMFSIVMFYVNPLIDGKNGFEVIGLQLAFNKSVGIELVRHWGDSGINNFKSLIFTDYIYAVSYSLFFSSLLSFLIFKNNKSKHFSYTWVVYLAFLAGILDCIENTIELRFLENTAIFSDDIFLIHSWLAVFKWATLPVILGYVLVLSVPKKNTMTIEKA
ncbi:hypothetical protein [Endozoicomonas sp. ALD040]|uniref:hypothetical protein n=1 Tax=unclassified Endozoicomonas TaxID=2644528 RepID=UPI003BAF75FC